MKIKQSTIHTCNLNQMIRGDVYASVPWSESANFQYYMRIDGNIVVCLNSGTSIGITSPLRVIHCPNAELIV